jgi:putative RNA 2'-phosphotransferase
VNAAERRRLSKLLSLALRHDPAALGVELDPRGFCAVDPLVEAVSRRLGFAVSRADIEALAAPPARQSPAARRSGATKDTAKTRFELEGDFIRAGHGHSLPIVGYRPCVPCGPLYHATVRSALPAIRLQGLRAMARQKVHLSHDRAITLEAARRRSRDTVLIQVDVARAFLAGVGFYESADPRIVLSDDLDPRLLWHLEQASAITAP